MLVDNVTILVRAGKGGNGRVSFRRNAQTAKGGPDGGNGGNGGNIYLQGVDDILGLATFRFKKEVLAEEGVPGGKKNLFGRNGKDTIVQIPVGTRVTDVDSGEVIEITNTTDKILIAKGGIGGRGNNEFKSATNQTPRIAEKGTPGEEKRLFLELKIIADVGFIGLPNAGKSSLLSILTNAHPKIGAYPFTTLEPNIGMLGNIALADIPGLIEGASSGKGLGMEFLRHVEKTQLLIHCIAGDTQDVYGSYTIIRKELEQYAESLSRKKEVILLTKIDLISPEEKKKKLQELKKTKKDILTISLYDEPTIDAFKKFLLAAVEK